MIYEHKTEITKHCEKEKKEGELEVTLNTVVEDLGSFGDGEYKVRTNHKS